MTLLIGTKNRFLGIFFIIPILMMIVFSAFFPNWIMKICNKEIRQELLISAEKFPESLLIIARSSLNNEQIHWFHEKEFLWNGQMFDVIRVEHTVHGEILYCFKDTKEKELLANFFNDFIDEKANSDWLIHFYKLLLSDILLNANDYCIAFAKNPKSYTVQFSASQAYYAVPFKPPQ